MVNKQLFLIFGNPVLHSKSPLMHNLAFEKLGIDAFYSKFKLEDKNMLREMFFRLNLSGANITVPFKTQAFDICDYRDSFSEKFKSVNTIVRKENKLFGYNTDALGFLDSISYLKKNSKILILGAGGTAQSTSIILKDNNYDITILNRGEEKLNFFKERGFENYNFQNFPINSKYDVIVNMTSAGLKDDYLPAPIEILKKIIPKSEICIDIIYGKETPFLKLAKKENKKTQDGSEMLLSQGVLAFEHFTDKKFKSELIKKYMKEALNFS